MKKRIVITICALLALTAVIASVYLLTREKVPENSLLVKTQNGSVSLSINDLELSDVSGETVNKKGETKKIEAKGYSLSDIPELAGISEYSEVCVFSDDEYNASVSSDELSDHGKAWLITEDEGLRLIVFGDSDSKRNVKNVVRIEIR